VLLEFSIAKIVQRKPGIFPITLPSLGNIFVGYLGDCPLYVHYSITLTSRLRIIITAPSPLNSLDLLKLISLVRIFTQMSLILYCRLQSREATHLQSKHSSLSLHFK
jgi:hypothetical protein